MITHFYKRLSDYIKIYLLLLILFTLFRLLFLSTYCDVDIFQHYKGDLLKTFWVGFRCDTVVLCFSLFPLFALNLLEFLFFWKQLLTNAFHRFLQFFSKCYYIIIFVVFFWVNVCDYFYYRNFQSHFDNRVFGIIEDGTKEVLASVWADYPVITVTLIFFLALFGWIKMVNRIQSQGKPLFIFNSIGAHIATVILSSGLLFIGARSSFTTFPFQKNALVFSPHTRLNDATANGVFSLNEAISDRVQHSLHLNSGNLLAIHGFNSLDEAKKVWNSEIITDSCNFFERITTDYHSFLDTAPPNIVLIIMEGWSSDLFNFHSKQFNLLGALEEELQQLIFFPFCFPVNFGTISAMETFFTNNVGPALSLSEYANIQLRSSTALTFSNKGYETSYYTGGYTGWRNIGKYSRTQGFDNVFGAEYIKALFPQTKEADWGVYDQYMFDAMFHHLQEKNNQPQFIIGMTITNHTPHKIPKSYSLYPLEFPDSMRTCITGNVQQTLCMMQTFQYANDCLGRFISQLRQSPSGRNTIIVITGDHSMTGSFAYKDHEFVYRWAVPLAFYIPENYNQNLNINTHRLVSHKDIIPTIYHLAFSNFSYRATGDPIFASTNVDDSFVITQSSWVMGKAGAIHLNTHQSYRWTESGYYLKPQEKTQELEALRSKANAWLFGMKWQIYRDIR